MESPVENKDKHYRNYKIKDSKSAFTEWLQENVVKKRSGN
jgi:hypothetical protein